ncbi:IS3 family transposase [Psychrobacillus soli]|uniref:IS3 family transposase n=1 Tax=Psychrobacillus soli TaxID=1543965 RepID=A0A544SLE5_9BACI|nr:IS3 family transposase [Psychrobacillus soli]TQR05962.1 IS3 family transposase [Psychrobacillus soli]
MRKRFSLEEKYQAVLLYLSGRYSYREVAKQTNVDTKSVIMWVALYQRHGKEALNPKRSFTFYETAFKLDVLKYRTETNASYIQTAVHFNLTSPYTVQRWEERFKKAGSDAFVSKKEGPTTMPKNRNTNEKDKNDMAAEIERLRMEVAYFKKVECLSSKQGKIATKQDKAQVVYELRHEFPVMELVKLAGIPRSTYYDLVKRVNQPDPDADLKAEIKEIYEEHDGRYGYRRIRDELTIRGQVVNHKKVQRIMKELGLKCLVRMKKYKSYKGTVGKIAPNILDRQFTAEQPNEKWVTDITEFKLFGEKLYLSPVLDLFNSEIITYTIGSRPTYSLVSEMLDKALEYLPENHSLLMHSDQGWHYQMKQYRNALKNRGVIQSMSRKGNCYDNSVMENFFGILKSEFLYLKEFESVDHFKQELQNYINYYNHKRLKSKFKMSPVQYRTHLAQAA